MARNALLNSLLADVEDLPFVAPETVREWGRTLIVAPHPDDESLGCGGAIALLRAFEQPVFVLTMSDGAMSHPNSPSHPPDKLRDLREREMLAALETLRVEAANVTFFRYRDRAVPNSDAADFSHAVARLQNYLRQIEPQTIITPWRRDPHPDHRATTAIVSAAIADSSIKLLEYPIWLWELADAQDAPRRDEATAFRLDIKTVNRRKQLAISAHQSQITDLINDDPTAFRLRPEDLAHFAGDDEIYLEQTLFG